MPRYRKKVCRECGRVYLRRYVRTNPTLGWCGPRCYRKSYFRRREGKAAGELPDPVDDSAIQDPRVIEALAAVLREESMEEAMAEEQSADGIEESDEAGKLHLEVVADRAPVAQTRLGEDDRVEVEWVGRCWAWLTEGEAPSLMNVVVRDGEIVKLLEPGRVRRVRAVERTIETPEGEVDGLEVRMEFRGFRAEPEPDLRATARGLWEGGKVRIAGEHWRAKRGKIGTLLKFTTGVVEVEGKRFGAGLGKLEPLDSPDEPTDPVDASAVEELRMREAPAEALRGESGEDAAGGKRVSGDDEEMDEPGELLVGVVADRALVAQTRLGEDYRVGVEWVGRCWVWLTVGEAPSLMDVVVSEAAVAKLLEPGQVRRVRAMERTIETAEGAVEGLELWAEFRAELEPDLRATARGLWEGGKVRIPPEYPWLDEEGKIGTLLRFSAAFVEVDGRRFAIGPRDLEALESPDDSPTGPGSGS